MSVRPESRRRPGANERSQEESVGFTRGNPMAAIFLGLIVGAVLGFAVYMGMKPAAKNDGSGAAAGQNPGPPAVVKQAAAILRPTSYLLIDKEGQESTSSLPNRFGPEAREGMKVSMDFADVKTPGQGAFIRLRLYAMVSTDDISAVVCTVKDGAGLTLGSGKPNKPGAWFDIPLSGLTAKEGKVRLVLSSTARLLLCSPADNVMVSRGNGENYTPYIEVTYP